MRQGPRLQGLRAVSILNYPIRRDGVGALLRGTDAARRRLRRPLAEALGGPGRDGGTAHCGERAADLARAPDLVRRGPDPGHGRRGQLHGAPGVPFCLYSGNGRRPFRSSERHGRAEGLGVARDHLVLGYSRSRRRGPRQPGGTVGRGRFGPRWAGRGGCGWSAADGARNVPVPWPAPGAPRITRGPKSLDHRFLSGCGDGQNAPDGISDARLLLHRICLLGERKHRRRILDRSIRIGAARHGRGRLHYHCPPICAVRDSRGDNVDQDRRQRVALAEGVGRRRPGPLVRVPLLRVRVRVLAE